MPFDVNEEKNASSTTKLLTASRPANVLSTALYKTTNHKTNLEKIIGLTSFQKCTISVCFNLLQVCSSLPTFVFALCINIFF